MMTLFALLALQEDWDYSKAMKVVAAKFKGKEGVVLHVGDSITYANPYSGWAKFGQGRTKEDQEILRWMHAGKGDDTDGWHLASVDRPGNRSETAVSGIRADEWLVGGKSGIPPLGEVLKKYSPRMVVLMLGTNDASAGRAAAAYRADMEKCVDAILAQAAIPILSTIPPHPQKLELAKSYNVALRDLAKARKIPLIDYEREILKRRPNDWNGTLLGKDDVHPTAGPGGEPTEENLRNSGYLLRGWLSVRKIAEVKARVLGASTK